MRIDEEINQLKERIKHLEWLQSQCEHDWGKSKYDPEKIEIIKYEEDYHKGTEYFYKEIHTGEYEFLDRWSRTCKKCGLKQYTKEAETVIVEKKPRF